MSHNFSEGLPSTYAETLIAAQTRQREEQMLGTIKQQKERLSQMVAQGIISEVLDLLESLEVPHEDALPLLIQTYKKTLDSTRLLAKFWATQQKPDLSEKCLIEIEILTQHIADLKNGTITLEQEYKKRQEERISLGYSTNPYTDLREKPFF